MPLDAVSNPDDGTNDIKLWRRQHPTTATLTRLCRSRWVWILCVGGGLLVYRLVRLYYEIELMIDDPFLEATLYFPLRTFYIRYLDDKPAAERRTFRSTANNTFVINLERDTERRNQFEKVNSREKGVGVPYQFFSATEWENNVENTNVHHSSNHNESESSAIDIDIARQARTRQEEYARTYAFVSQKAAQRHYGDAASTLSHIRLMEQLLASSEDFYFIFEDDAVLKEPFRSTGAVQAPSDAQVVFLVQYATKKVKVKAVARGPATDEEEDDNNQDEVRVVQGYGAMGYVVTRTGAELILRHLRGHPVPFDVALAGEPWGLRVYQPVGWPLVGHRPIGGSRRHAINAVKIG